MMSLKVVKMIISLESVKLRDLKKDLENLRNDLNNYKYSTKIDEYTDRAIYNIVSMLQADVFDMSITEIKEHLSKLQHVLEFISL